MKTTLTLMTILLIITLILSPFITPFPALFVFIGLCFYALSKAFSSPPDYDVEKSLNNILQPTSKETIEKEEETGDKLDVIEENDRIIVTEVRTIMKKDLTYADFRKYNIKNINCVKDCISFKAPRVSGNKYDAGHKKCTICDIWIKFDGVNCPCCSSLLRTRINVKKDETGEGTIF